MGHYPFNLILIIETQLKTFKNFYDVNITMEKLQSALVIGCLNPTMSNLKYLLASRI